MGRSRRARHAARHAGIREALSARVQVDAVEIGADDEVLADGLLDGRDRVRQAGVAHMAPYSPEWAAGICDVPAGTTMRTIANEYLAHACVGQTVTIGGKMIPPFRPVAVTLGKTVNNGWGGYECCWAHAAGVAGRRARSAGRHHRHHGAAGRPWPSGTTA